MKNASTQQLFDLVKTKHGLLQQLRAMTIEQQPLVSDQEVSDLLVLLSRKSQVLESLQSVQNQLRAFEDQSPEDRVWESPAKRQACRQTLAQCDALLAELVVMEQTSLGQLTEKRDVVAGQLQQFATNETISEAYAVAMEAGSLDSNQLILEG
jgi:hypothetical protein